MSDASDPIHDDPRLTAFALGELEGTELAEIASRVDADPSLQALVAEIRATGAELERELLSEPAPKVAPKASPPAVQRFHRRNRRVQVALGVAGVAAMTLVVLVLGTRSADLSERLALQEDPGPAFDSTGQGERLKRRVVADAIEPTPEGEPLAAGVDRTVEKVEPQERWHKDPTAEMLPGTATPERDLLSVPVGSASSPARPVSEEDDLLGGAAQPRRRRVPEAEPLSTIGDRYAPLGENGFTEVREQPVSTFSIDVDTASYAQVRRLLEQGVWPPHDAVRIEEMINYFRYDMRGPADRSPVAIQVEVARAPWKPEHLLARVALKAKEVYGGDRPSANLVFLIDVSGSMNEPLRLPLVKDSLRMLLGELQPSDTVALVVYAGNSGLVLPATPVKDRGRILKALDALEAGGSTNGASGIATAYEEARRAFKKDGVNRVILATDGDFNVGITDRGQLQDLIQAQAKSGVFLTVLGYGMSHNDATLELLADKGNGHYAYIDRLSEAKKVLVDEVATTLVPIAKDVKVQLELNPAQIKAYRLIGYENRQLANKDFNDDKKDAGEMGAGHSVTMLYELVPIAGAPASDSDALRYQGTLTDAAQSGELFNVKVRYKQPDADKSELRTQPARGPALAFADASEDFRFATAVAAFGLVLRASPEWESIQLEQAKAWARAASHHDPGGLRRELISLITRAQELVRRERAVAEETPRFSEPVPRQLDDSDILTVLRMNRDDVRTCLEKQTAADPTLDGAMQVRMVIEKNGQARRVTVVPDRFKNTVLGNCIIAKVPRWRFPTFTGPAMPIDFPVHVRGR